MRKTVIFIILFVVSLVGIGYLSLSGSSDEIDVWITIDNDGNFLPSEIKIKKGTTVGWLNESDVDSWPASNLHPSHLVFPEFDSLGPIATKNSWTFKFNRSGVWRFHDHLNPIKTGIVTVD